MASGNLRVIRAHDGFGVGEVGNVCVIVWRGDVTAPRFEAQRDGLAEVVARHPGGAALLCVIEPTSAPPDDALRRASARMISAHQGKLRSIACVVEGSGFKSAVARSALSAIALILGRRETPFSVFGVVGSSTAWMSTRGAGIDAASLAGAVERLRSQLS